MPLNERLLRLEFAKQGEKTLVKQVRPYIQLDFETKKDIFFEEFDAHPVTQELEAGPTAYSSIPSLAYSGGNLFSFLGFFSNQNPAQALRKYLEKNIKLGRTKAGKPHGEMITFSTPVNFPTLEEVDGAMSSEKDGKLEWTDRGFTSLISRGIPHLGQYIFDIAKGWGFPPSRSGTAIQTKNKIRSGSFGGVPYMNELLGRLKRMLTVRK